MAEQIKVSPEAVTDQNELGELHEVSPMLAYLRTAIANVVFFGRANAADRGWVLVDAGVWGSASSIRAAATKRFGKQSRPAAIILTHGHFDHVGALRELAEHWDVPIYAHEREHPFLDGRESYPAPDPTVGGGLTSSLSRFYPRGPIDVGKWLRPMPLDFVPGMPDWEWIATPGHTEGHISLWHPASRSLIAGDAFITTKQESAYAVLTQRPELHGPPQYFTPDWQSARTSVQRLAILQPELAITGHGPAMQGKELRLGLLQLSERFDEVAVPH